MKQIRRAWTEEENQTIRSLAGKVSLQEIAGQLNRSESSTRVQAWKLGVKSTMVNGLGRTVESQQPVPKDESVEQIVAPAAIERALSIYEQLQEHDQSVILQARKILTQHIYGMVDRGECDEQRLTVGGLIRLKAIERDHAIKSAQAVPSKEQRGTLPRSGTITKKAKVL
jgi:hypothetical protein